MNECLHGIYGYDDELVCLERIDCDVDYLVSIQDRFDEEDAFLIGIWIDKLTRAFRAPLQNFNHRFQLLKVRALPERWGQKLKKCTSENTLYWEVSLTQWT